MSVRIFQDELGGGYYGDFPDPAYTLNLGNYSMGNTGYTWNDQVSSLYTSTRLMVFEDADHTGYFAILPAGFHPLESLLAYGIDNNSISSFVALPGTGIYS